jgi:hypothetical protein
MSCSNHILHETAYQNDWPCQPEVARNGNFGRLRPDLKIQPRFAQSRQNKHFDQKGCSLLCHCAASRKAVKVARGGVHKSLRKRRLLQTFRPALPSSASLQPGYRRVTAFLCCGLSAKAGSEHPARATTQRNLP